jgi:hypothetical protein
MPRTKREPQALSGRYHLISTETPAETTFAIHPEEVILLATLEIPIADSHGEYLLVISPRYEPVRNSASVETSQWTPPFVAQMLPKPRGVGWRTVGQVAEKIAEAKRDGVEGWQPQQALEEIIATWACGLCKVTLAGEFTEYKTSWSNPAVMKAYHILRYTADMGTCIVHAIADADSRKGFAFLPIDDERYATAVSERHCIHHGVRELLFIGKPLATNLSHVVDSKATREALAARAKEIPREAFYTDHHGLLVCGDIANYGSACMYATRHMQGIDIRGDDAATLLGDLATSAITRIFHDAGISQPDTAGDGFVAAVPVEPGEALDAYLRRFLAAYRRFTSLLDAVSDRMASHHDPGSDGQEPPPRLGSRLAVHYGRYRYGKMAQAASLTTSFDGPAVIDVARLEQGLRAIMKDESRSTQLGIRDEQHIVIVSVEGLKAIGETGLPPGLVGGHEVTATSKEAVAQAHVYEFVAEKVAPFKGRAG